MAMFCNPHLNKDKAAILAEPILQWKGSVRNHPALVPRTETQKITFIWESKFTVTVQLTS